MAIYTWRNNQQLQQINRRGAWAFMEPIEVSEFREKMEEVGEKHERTMMRVSLIISVLAAMVATVTVLGHREHTEAVLVQSRAGDMWQQYQSRKVRQQELLDSSDLLSVQANVGTPLVQAKLAQYKTQTDKLQTQMEEESKQARELQSDVNKSESRAGRFDLGEALLQIAVVLASITLLTRHHRYVVVGCILGVAGVAVTASAYLLH
jgi:hypothetical protein